MNYPPDRNRGNAWLIGMKALHGVGFVRHVVQWGHMFWVSHSFWALVAIRLFQASCILGGLRVGCGGKGSNS